MKTKFNLNELPAIFDKINELAELLSEPEEVEKVVPMRGNMTLDEVNVSLFDECQRLQAGLLGMKPMEDAPRDGTYIILFAPSGYNTTQWRCEICHYDAEYRPRQPWVNHASDSFTEGGDEPCGWLPLPSE